MVPETGAHISYPLLSPGTQSTPWSSPANFAVGPTTDLYFPVPPHPGPLALVDDAQLPEASSAPVVVETVTLANWSLWLILFKTSIDFSSVLLNYQSRSLNLVPFAGYARGNAREMLDNFVVFVPLGLLLGINLKRTSFWRKLSFVFLFSVTAEVMQFVLAIGTSDITDVATNTLGGLFGLALYDVSKKYVENEKLDQCIIAAITALLLFFLFLRFLVFKVRY
jgi:glycopeptide antibiotics resistance protein